MKLFKNGTFFAFMGVCILNLALLQGCGVTGPVSYVTNTSSLARGGNSSGGGGTVSLPPQTLQVFRGGLERTGRFSSQSGPSSRSGSSWSIRLSSESNQGIYSSPVVDVQGNVYVGSGSTLALKGYFTALNASGNVLWRKEIATGPVLSSPALSSNSILYFGDYGRAGSGSGTLHALRASDGSVVWQKTLDAAIKGSPAITTNGATIYIGTGGGLATSSNGGKMYSLRASDGATNWVFDVASVTYGASEGVGTKRQIDSSAAIDSEGNIYFTSLNNFLFKLSSSGSLIWRFNLRDGSSSTPAIDTDGTIYVATVDATNNNVARLFAINSDGTQKWSVFVGALVSSSVSIGTNGNVYIASSLNDANDGVIFAFNKANGAESWRYVVSGAGEINSPISIDREGYLYSGDFKGNFFSLVDNGSSFSVRFSNNITASNEGSSKSIDTSSSAIFKGIVYVGSDNGYVHAVR